MPVSAEKYYCFQQNFIMTLLPHWECGIMVIISFHNCECGAHKYWTWYSHPDYISSSLDWTLFLYPRVRVRPLPILCLHKLHSRFSFDSAISIHDLFNICLNKKKMLFRYFQLISNWNYRYDHHRFLRPHCQRIISKSCIDMIWELISLQSGFKIIVIAFVGTQLRPLYHWPSHYHDQGCISRGIGSCPLGWFVCMRK